MKKKIITHLAIILAVIGLLYLFLVSINLMGISFKGFGSDFAENLIKTTSNPFIALFIGILATSIIQSSSTTTSIVVGMVSAGTLTIPCAIPIVMGANIGTSVTNTFVSFAHVTRKEEFKRAFSGALVHDIFNVFCVIVLFPLELATNFLERSATFFSHQFAHSAAFKFSSPLKTAIKPATDLVDYFFYDILHLSERAGYVCMLIMALALMFFALAFIVKLMRVVVIEKTEAVLSNVLGKVGIIGIIMGTVFTVLVQSSSVTTSLLIPLAASGIVTLEQILPVVLGANIGTTITAILASFAGTEAGVTIAFVHLLFNVLGILIFYPFRFTRALIIGKAEKLGELALRSRKFAFLYVLTMFFLIPLLLIALSKIF
jgi:solute carrier family 34 (sodium-dependent phosphate cotransporter)